MIFDPLYQDEYEPEGILLSTPFTGRQRVRQGWGVNPPQYSQIVISGVPLLGHNGLDFELAAGTEVLAVDAGQVIKLGDDPGGYGTHLKLLHRWGESLYAHLQDFSVYAGEIVHRGQVIGYAGGSRLGGPRHLHFAIRIDPYQQSDGWGGYTNPLPFLDPQNLVVDTASLP